MVRVYLELSTLIALANSLDLFHDETQEFLNEIKRLGFEPISCRQAVEMDLAIGVAKRPLRVTDALNNGDNRHLWNQASEHAVKNLTFTCRGVSKRNSIKHRRLVALRWSNLAERRISCLMEH